VAVHRRDAVLRRHVRQIRLPDALNSEIGVGRWELGQRC
jgi:hypothetical protein